MDDFQELVYARWKTFPKGYSISVGDYGTITKSQAIEHIKNNDEIGTILIRNEREYFNALRDGTFYECLIN